MFTPRYFIDVRNSSSVPFRVYLYSMDTALPLYKLTLKDNNYNICISSINEDFNTLIIKRCVLSVLKHACQRMDQISTQYILKAVVFFYLINAPFPIRLIKYTTL